MYNRRHAEKGLIKSLILAITIGTAAHGGLSAYLPLVGPPPLRLTPVPNPQPASEAKLEGPTPKEPVAAPTVMTVPPTSNALDFDPIVAAGGSNAPALVEFPAPLPIISPNAADAMDDTFGAGGFNLATPDLLNITPQMLTTFFRPVASGTNGPVILTGPNQFIFVPPQASPEKSSTAEYHVK